MAREMVCKCIYSIYFLTILYVSTANVLSELVPVIKSISVINETFISNKNSEVFSNVTVEMRGDNFFRGMKVRATTFPPEYGECSGNSQSDSDSDHDFSVLWSNSTYSTMALLVKVNPNTNNKDFYVCVRSVVRTTTGDQSTFLSTFPSEVIKWVHQGENVVFRTASENVLKSRNQGILSSKQIDSRVRLKRQWNTTSHDDAESSWSDNHFHVEGTNHKSNLTIYGYRLENSDKEPRYEDNGIVSLRVGTSGEIRLFGDGWTDDTYFTLTTKRGNTDEYCEAPVNNEKFQIVPGSMKDHSALLKINIPEGNAESFYFLCYRKGSNEIRDTVFTPDHRDQVSSKIWRHVGNNDIVQIGSYQKLLPFWLSLTIILTCLGFSSLFSGLNLGLMSLNNTELKIISNTGTALERKYAAKIIPVRKHGNYLLCSILLGNVMVNSTFTILLDDLTSGLVAVIASTLCIVILGEITPQAVCSRHGLCIGARTIIVTKVVMLVTFPLAYPISKILDLVLGEEIGAVYTRERLKELIKLTTEYSELEKDEVNIISGALELRKKIVSDVMTKLEDVYMLSYDAVLNFETVSEIMKSGYSRIPVYQTERRNIVTVLYINHLALVDPNDETPLETLCKFYDNPCYFVFEDMTLDVLFRQFKLGYSRVPVFESERHNIVTVLFTKDLALVDPDDNTPLKTLCQFYQNPFYFVFEDTTLDVLLKQFKEGNKGHMAFVHRVNNEGEGDPFYETVGIITLEDVIEELIQAEIMDETDVWTDNRSKHRRSARAKQDFTAFAERSEVQRIHISPQLTLATFQYLSTSVDPFKPDVISESVLSRLLKQDIIHHIKMKKDRSKNDPDSIIYQQGKPVDYFVLILEGRVEVTVGRENLVFESGPFTYFGLQALMQTVGVAESPTGIASASQQLGSLQSVNLDAMLRHSFVPDYTVRAITEVFYLSVKRSLFLAAKRATLMERSKKEEVQSGDVFDAEVEKLLNSLGDDDSRGRGSPDAVPRSTRPQVVASGQGSPTMGSIINNGTLFTASEPLLISPSRTPRSATNSESHLEERSNLLGTNVVPPTS